MPAGLNITSGHEIDLGRVPWIMEGMAEPDSDGGHVDAGPVHDRELVVAGGHRPVELEGAGSLLAWPLPAPLPTPLRPSVMPYPTVQRHFMPRTMPRIGDATEARGNRSVSTGAEGTTASEHMH